MSQTFQGKISSYKHGTKRLADGDEEPCGRPQEIMNVHFCMEKFTGLEKNYLGVKKYWTRAC